MNKEKKIGFWKWLAKRSTQILKKIPRELFELMFSIEVEIVIGVVGALFGTLILVDRFGSLIAIPSVIGFCLLCFHAIYRIIYENKVVY